MPKFTGDVREYAIFHTDFKRDRIEIHKKGCNNFSSHMSEDKPLE